MSVVFHCLVKKNQNDIEQTEKNFDFQREIRGTNEAVLVIASSDISVGKERVSRSDGGGG